VADWKDLRWGHHWGHQLAGVGSRCGPWSLLGTCSRLSTHFSTSSAIQPTEFAPSRRRLGNLPSFSSRPSSRGARRTCGAGSATRSRAARHGGRSAAASSPTAARPCASRPPGGTRDRLAGGDAPSAPATICGLSGTERVFSFFCIETRFHEMLRATRTRGFSLVRRRSPERSSNTSPVPRSCPQTAMTRPGPPWPCWSPWAWRAGGRRWTTPSGSGQHAIDPASVPR